MVKLLKYANEKSHKTFKLKIKQHKAFFNDQLRFYYKEYKSFFCIE
jgi:hypothetical protein